MDKELDRLLNEWKGYAGKINPNLLPLINKFILSCKGGKRLRGKLVVLGYQLAKQGEKEILKVAAAYEIMHSAILAHDDIIDQSPLRRGRPSLHKSVGVEQAITLADLGFFLAIKIIAESKFEDKLKIKALGMFSKIMVDTAIGQMLDIQKGDSLTIRKLKTAQYTVAGPLQLGAVLGGAKRNLLDQLDKFGENLGVAFQIRDDILDGEVKSVDEAGVEALKYANQAKKMIGKISNDHKIIKQLEELCTYLVERRA
ncbi:polyprenyl synthetase family protein [Candidatus Daviesbacteria bacterium]|nr:polyprenyl synthetase family protein [Candidatus Daviesbacteria bacterium]